eukprot:c9622_g1_i1.p1 GENE.c9622_g1_i1~~c9622_g1_i1.p1  ORF type:complete len:294 (+),score=36.22 c9622_g1_i1:50-883(+)
MGSCCSFLTSEFTTDNLDFNRSTSQGLIYWGYHFGVGRGSFANSSLYQALRGVLLAIVSAILVYSILHFVDTYGASNFSFYFIYLTHWSLLLEVLYFAFAFCTTWAAQYSRAEDRNRQIANSNLSLPFFVRATWLLQAIVLPASFMVMVMYWTLVYSGGPILVVQVLQHGVTFVLMVVDFLSNRQPYLLLHGVYFMIYAAAFYLWSYIHYALHVHNEVGHDYIYAALNWANPKTSGIIGFLILCIVVPLTNFLFWFVFYLVSSSSEAERARLVDSAL